MMVVRVIALVMYQGTKVEILETQSLSDYYKQCDYLPIMHGM